ncbi:MAG: ComF family protein [Pseudomonadota bacterium]
MPGHGAPRHPLIKRIARWPTEWLFPRRCPISGEALPADTVLSSTGFRRLTFLGAPGCVQCGMPFAHSGAAAPLCVACAGPPASLYNLCAGRKLDRIRTALVYDKVSAPLILGLKYGDRHDIGLALGALMRGPVQALEPDPDTLVVPVPLHPERLRMRRFNQSAVLARALVKGTGLKVAPQAVRRIKATPQQKGRGFEGRFRNIAGAFEADPAVNGRSIVLVDDVLTSGATLVGAARALRKAGASNVAAVTATRVVPNTKDPDIDLPEL